MAQQYSQETKARVIAAAQMGQPKAAIARELKVSRSYVQQVTRDIPAQAVLSPEKQVDLGEEIFDLIVELARGAKSVARQLQDPGWLQGQSADHLAISLGVAIDKMAGLVGAIQRGQQQRALPGPDSQG